MAVLGQDVSIKLILKTQYKISQDKNDTKVLMWIGKQVVLSLIEKEIFYILDQKLNIKYLSGATCRDFQDVEDASFLS